MLSDPRRSRFAAPLLVLLFASTSGPGVSAQTLANLSPNSVLTGQGTPDNSAAWDAIDNQVGLAGLWGSIDSYLDSHPTIFVRPSDDRLFLFWARWDGNDREIVYAARPSGGVWSGVLNVEDADNAQDDIAPSVTMDSGGYLNLAWMRMTQSGGVILHSVRINGLWTAPTRISGSADSRHPSLRIDTGRTLVTYRTSQLRITAEITVYVGSGVSDDIDPTQVFTRDILHELLVN